MTWNKANEEATRASAELWQRSGESWRRLKVRKEATLQEARAMLQGSDCVVRWMAPGSPLLCASTAVALEAFRELGQ